MPNWCENFLTANGPKEEIEKFSEKVSQVPSYYSGTVFEPESNEVPFYFSGHVPIPQEVVEGKEEWNDWCVKNWGTKWDACECQPPEIMTTENISSFSVDFLTAWSPPIKWLEKVAKEHPNIEFEIHYTEHGMGFTGKAIGKEGEVFDECFNM